MLFCIVAQESTAQLQRCALKGKLPYQPSARARAWLGARSEKDLHNHNGLRVATEQVLLFAIAPRLWRSSRDSRRPGARAALRCKMSGGAFNTDFGTSTCGL